MILSPRIFTSLLVADMHWGHPGCQTIPFTPQWGAAQEQSTIGCVTDPAAGAAAHDTA